MSVMLQSQSLKSAAHGESWHMFDRIARRYDLLNRLLSFRRDVAWRRVLCRSLPEGEALEVLDLATGTADVLVGLFAAPGKVRRGVGLDMSANMLSLAGEKLAQRGLDGTVSLLRSSAAAIGMKDDVFDAATMAFGVRNVGDVPAALAEIRRVLKPGGRALILEFSLPRHWWFRGLYLFYFRHILPAVGGLISGDRAAYRYLNRSVEGFPHGEAFKALLEDAGFGNTQARTLTFGIATLYQGDKKT